MYAVCNADKIIDTVQMATSFKVSAEAELSVIKAAPDSTDRAAADSQLSNDESAIQVRIPHTHNALQHCHPRNVCQADCLGGCTTECPDPSLESIQTANNRQMQTSSCAAVWCLSCDAFQPVAAAVDCCAFCIVAHA